MAYTRPWSQVFALAGSRDSDEIDDNDREHHTDLTERLSDILEDPAADPWKLKSQGFSLTTRYHWSMGYVGVPTSGTVAAGNFVSLSASGASVSIHVPIPIGKGNKLIEVKFRFQLVGAGPAANGQVFKNNAAAGSVAVSGVVNAVGPLWADYSTGALSEVVADGESFFAIVHLANGSGFANFMDMEVTLGLV